MLVHTVLFCVLGQGSRLRGADPAEWGRFGHHAATATTMTTTPSPTPAASDYHCPVHVKCIEVYPEAGCELVKYPSRDAAGCLEYPCGKVFCKRVDCAMAPWGPWSACDAKCGLGEHFRRRVVAQPARGGGKPCAGKHRQDKECHAFDPSTGKRIFCQYRHKPCRLSHWGFWGACVQDPANDTCGGWRTRRRKIKQFKHGECLVPLTEKVFCTVGNGCKPKKVTVDARD